ncbi:MAG: restriction endonuclease subunit S [Candidatus Marinimicrobia bacterium]|nr:restriction endonuclease subunit S [Candidatus Neomarinimicrobiota bacterium]
MAVYSIIQKSKLERAKRIDAEYYQPEYLKVAEKLASIETKTINEISESVVNFGAYSLCNYIEWQDKGVPYLNVQDIKEGHIDFSGTKFISEKVNEILKKSKVQEGQVIITMAGSVGNVAVAHNIPQKVNSNQATAKITLNKNFSPYFLAAFLNCYYGEKQTKRDILSSVQPNIFLFQIKNFKIPVVSNEKQKEVEKTYKDGLKELENSKSLYQQAEDLLLEELGLKDFETEDELSNIVNFSDVKNVNRIDAEYFEKKYKKIIEKIESYKNGFVKISDEFTQNKKTTKKEKEEYNYVEIGNVNVSSGEIEFNKIEKEDLPANAKIELKENDILVSKVRPYRGAVGIVNSNKENLLGSGAFTVLKEKGRIKKEVLVALLKTKTYKELILRDNVGTSYPVIKDENVLNLQIPLLPKQTQEKIADLVKKSHEARQKSKELLEEARTKVEKLIEGKN